MYPSEPLKKENRYLHYLPPLPTSTTYLHYQRHGWRAADIQVDLAGGYQVEIKQLYGTVLEEE